MTENGTPTLRREAMSKNVATQNQEQLNRQVEQDLDKAKLYYKSAKHPLLKLAYYKLWYSILVIKHKGDV